MKAQQAAWREANRGHLKRRGETRRLNERARCLVAAARARARRSGVPFTLEDTDIVRIQGVIDRGACELSGVPFRLDGGRTPDSPSLDRIVPALGYAPGNVRVVCHCLNTGMGDWGEAELRRIVAAWLAQ
jgi:hypothetical protein